MSNTLTSFRSILDAIEATDGRATVSFPADWAQGRGIFGGLVTAAALRAARTVIDTGRRPRSLMVSFVGPLSVGDADIELRLLRQGSSATSVEAHVTQGGEPRAVVLASFALERSSSVSVAAPKRPSAPRAADLPEFPFVPDQTPTFTRHFAHRWTIGQAPFSWAREAEVGGWCRFREDQGLGDEEVVLALVDAWPAPMLPLLREPAPASTVTWSVGLFDVAATARADDWWFFHGRTSTAAAGHAHATGMLWAPSGNAVALSQQLVAVFD